MTVETEDDYGVWMRAQIQARRFSRLATVLGVFAAGAMAYFSPQAGEHGYISTAVLGLLAALLVGRAVEHVALGFTGPSQKPASTWLALGGLVLAGATTWTLLVYFDGLFAEQAAARYYYERDVSDERAIITFIAAAIGGVLFFLITKRREVEVSFSTEESGEPSRPATADHGVDIVKARLAIGAIAAAVATMGPYLSHSLFDYDGLVPVTASALAALVIWLVALSRVTDRARRARIAAAASEVQAELADIRKANARIWLGRVAGLAAGAATYYAGTHALDIYLGRMNHHGASYYSRTQPDISHWFVLIAAAVGAALAVSKLFAPKSDTTSAVPGITGGLFDDAIGTTGSIWVRQKLTLMSFLFGGMGKDQYEMLDGGQAFCGRAAETSGFFSRLFLGSRRPIDVSVDDLGREALRLRRGFLWVPFLNRAEVHEGKRSLGHITQRFSPFRRYSLHGPDGSERYELVSGFIFRSRFKLLRGGAEVGQLRRVRKPWYIRMFTPAWMQQDQFSLVFPQGAPIDERKLLVGSVFLLDITHYPTQSTLRWGALAFLILALIPGSAERDPYEDRTADRYDSYGDAY